MLVLDGSRGEGGGQILRTALAFSTLTGQSFELNNIRANRPQPGIKAQHLQSLETFARLTKGKSSPVSIGTKSIRYVPGEIVGGDIEINVGTAGSLTLIIQSILPVLIFSPKPIRIKMTGGTDTAWSPLWDTMQATLLPHLRHYAEIYSCLLIRGYYPKGGGKVDITVTSKFPKHTTWESFVSKTQLPSITLEKQGKLRTISGSLHLHKSYITMGEKLLASLKPLFLTYKVPINIELTYVNAANPGGGISIWSHYVAEHDWTPLLSTDSVLDHPSTFQSLGNNVVSHLTEAMQMGWCADINLMDQLIPYLAMAGGAIFGPPPSPHTQTNIDICHAFLGNVISVIAHEKGFLYQSTKPYK